MERTQIIMEIRVRIIPDTMVYEDSIPVRALSDNCSIENLFGYEVFI